MTQNIDKSNLRQVILDFPKQFEKGLEASQNLKLEGKFNAVVISGMGGSCIPGEMLKTYLEAEEKNTFPIFLNRSYELPKDIPENSLYFFLSYSGNTEETLSSLEKAFEKKLPLVCFASGGKMLQICQERNIPCVVMPSGIQPRCALGYFFASLLKVLSNVNLITEDFEKIIASAENLNQYQAELEQLGMETARTIFEKTPVIYAIDKWKSLAMILKIKINENAKTPAFWNYFPELNHNEMVGFSLPQCKFHFLTLQDKIANPQNIKRMEITAKLLKEKGSETTFLEMKGNNTFEKMFFTLLLGDWISYNLALKYNQDPTPVEMVENLKKLLV